MGTLITLIRLLFPFLKDTIFKNEEVRREFNENRKGLLALLVNVLFVILLSLLSSEIVTQRETIGKLKHDHEYSLKEKTFIQHTLEYEISRQGKELIDLRTHMSTLQSDCNKNLRQK